MKTLRAWLALMFPAGSFVLALTMAMAPARASDGFVRRSPQELDRLLAPIALYPDALIAIILPAATAPADIVLAARHVREFPNDRSQIGHRAWDESVKSLTHYPEVLQWLDENLDWTKQVGEAFVAQPADVMQAIQRLRSQARGAGTLVDTPYQNIIAEPDVIRIVPSRLDVIHVPRYEPEVVFVDRPVVTTQPLFTYGVGVPVGSWLAFECDWRRHTIWMGNRHRHWTPPNWHRPLVPHEPIHSGPHFARATEVRAWRPSPAATRSVTVTTTVLHHAPSPIVCPTPFGVSRPHHHPPSHHRHPSRHHHAGVHQSDPYSPHAPINNPIVTLPPQRTHGSAGHRGFAPVRPVPAPPPPAIHSAGASSFVAPVVTTHVAPPAAPVPHGHWQHRRGESGTRPPAHGSTHARGGGVVAIPAAPAAPMPPAPAIHSTGRTYSHSHHGAPAASVVVAPPPRHSHRAPPPAPVHAVQVSAPPPTAPVTAMSAPVTAPSSQSSGHRGRLIVHEN